MGGRSDEFVGGLKAQLPLLLGVAPFGMAYGTYAAKSGLPAGLSQAMSSIIFGGASQLIAARLFAESVPGTVVVLTVLLVNARHVLYSAALAPHFGGVNRRWRWLLAYLLTDEAYATAAVRYQRGDSAQFKHWYLFGSALTLWVTWQMATALGLFVGAAVPDSWSLDFALPLTFIAILVPAVKDRAGAAAAAVAGVVAIAGFRWPDGTGLLAAMVAGMFAGLATQALTARRPPRGESPT